MSSRGALVACIAVSCALHGVAGALMRAASHESDASEAESMVLTDIDVAPEPPEAHDPIEDEREPPTLEPAPEPEPEPEPAATVEPVPEPTLEPEEIAALAADAGVEPDALEVATAQDAGPSDGGVELAAAGDAGVELAGDSRDAGGDAGQALAALGPDAGAVAADGGAIAASAIEGRGGDDAGAGRRRGPVPAWVTDVDGAERAGAQGAAPGKSASGAADPGDAVATVGSGRGESDSGVAGVAPPGAGANLLAYFPQGEVVTLLLRLDRFRGTQWAQRMEAIVRPMPDYRSIVGSRTISFSDLFDTLVISSPRPEDVAATTLVGRYRRPDAQVRAFLNHREARVRWRAGRGGAVGHRLPSRFVLKHDRRVFLIPFPGMVLLAQPRYLGALVRRSSAPLGAARASEEEMPDWLKRVRAIELESGVESGPAVLLTMVGFPHQFEIPFVGTVPGPERLTLAAEITEGGFIVRGNLLFDSETRAAEFVEFADEKQAWLVGTYRGRLLLAPFHAFNAVKGLSLKRRGEKVAYATSISVADGRAMLDYGAEWTKVFFLSRIEAAESQFGEKAP